MRASTCSAMTFVWVWAGRRVYACVCVCVLGQICCIRVNNRIRSRGTALLDIRPPVTRLHSSPMLSTRTHANVHPVEVCRFDFVGFEQKRAQFAQGVNGVSPFRSYVKRAQASTLTHMPARHINAQRPRTPWQNDIFNLED